MAAEESPSPSNLKQLFEAIMEQSEPNFRYKFIATLKDVLAEKEQHCIQIVKEYVNRCRYANLKEKKMKILDLKSLNHG